MYSGFKLNRGKEANLKNENLLFNKHINNFQNSKLKQFDLKIIQHKKNKQKK